MTRWGIGLIGCGSVADFHVKAIGDIPRATLVAVSSRRAARAQAVAGVANCGWTTDYHDLLARDDIDLICLTTSSGTHGAIGLEVLEAGKHLLVEKPIAMTVAEADRLIEAAERNGVSLSVISQRRFEEPVQAARKVLEEGRLGRLLFVEAATPFYRDQAYYDSAGWRGTLSEDGGALMNQAIHQIDLCLWFGGEVDSVQGKVATQAHEMEAEDIGLAILSFQSGALGTITASTSLQPGFSPYVNLYGERGTIKIEGQAISHWEVPMVDPPETADPSGRQTGASDPRQISHDGHRKQIEDVLAASENGRPPAVTGEDGKRAIQLIHSIYRSSRSGRAVEAS